MFGNVKKWIITGIVAFVLFITLFSSFKVIPTGYTGVRVTFGQVDNVVVQNGINFKIPFVQSIEKVCNKQQDISTKNVISSETLERNEVYFDGITVSYTISPEKSAWIYANISNYRDNLVSESLIASAVKSASKTLSPNDVTARNILEPLVKDELQDSLNEKYGENTVTINKVVINNASFDEEYNTKLALKQQTQMAYETQQIENKTNVERAEAEAKAQLAKANADAEASIIAAKADAEIAKISADSAEYQGQKDAAIMSNLGTMLKSYPELIEYYKVQAWKGDVPTVNASDSTGLILNIDDLAK